MTAADTLDSSMRRSAAKSAHPRRLKGRGTVPGGSKAKLVRKSGVRGGAVVIIASKLRHQLGALLDKVSRHGARSRVKPVKVDSLSAEFDVLFEHMQTPAARDAMRKAFAASPEALGQSAVAAASRRRG